MSTIFEAQFTPSPPPLGSDQKLVEWATRSFRDLHNALRDKVGMLGQDGCWNDLTGSLQSAKASGSNQPGWAAFKGGIYTHEFSATTMNEVWIALHIKHDYKQGTELYPHVHWAPNGTDTGVCRWGIEYSIAKGYSQEVFSTPLTIYVEQEGSGTDGMHQIIETTEGNGIESGSIEVDSLILLRVFRDAAHANDTFTGTAWGLMVDMHYQMERVGTINRNGPDFYGR